MSLAQTERQLILLAAGTTARRQAMAGQARRSMTEIDWPQFAETLRQRRLLPVLGPRILELAQGSASDSFFTEVERALDSGRRQGAFLQLISLRTITLLRDAGIRVTPLKGALLGQVLYGDPGRRPSSDIDLLVEPEQLGAAVDVARDLGYEAPTDHIEPNGLPLLHFALAHERGELPALELHWRVHWYESRFARERLLPPTVALTADWRPQPIDELAALLLFYARDGFIDLRLAADIGTWWDIFGDTVPVAALDGLLNMYPRLARVLRVAARVAETVVGLPVPRLTGDMPRPAVRDRIALRLANPHPHTSPSQLYADMGLIDGLLSPPGGFGSFTRRQIFPPPEILDQQARHGERQRPRSSLGRATGVLLRYGRTMMRLGRTQIRRWTRGLR
jgi:hypothetical protein